MGLIFTHDDFFSMADSIFRKAKFEDFPGLEVYGDATLNAIGFVKAGPSGWRTNGHDQWRIPMGAYEKAKKDPRFSEVLSRLEELVKRARSQEDPA